MQTAQVSIMHEPETRYNDLESPEYVSYSLILRDLLYLEAPSGNIQLESRCSEAHGRPCENYCLAS